MRVGADDHRACLGETGACSSVYEAAGAEARTCVCSCMFVCVCGCKCVCASVCSRGPVREQE